MNKIYFIDLKTYLGRDSYNNIVFVNDFVKKFGKTVKSSLLDASKSVHFFTSKGQEDHTAISLALAREFNIYAYPKTTYVFKGNGVSISDDNVLFLNCLSTLISIDRQSLFEVYTDNQRGIYFTVAKMLESAKVGAWYSYITTPTDVTLMASSTT